MAKLTLRIHPDPILREISKEIEYTKIISKNIQELIRNLRDTMIQNNGIGLAAPQVGILKRIFVVYTKNGIIAWINPRILKKSFKKNTAEEGCLSIPQVFGKVKRHSKIKISAYNESGAKKIFTAEGLYARVIQHEIDHLNGILFIDKASEITQGRDKLDQYEGK